MRFEDTKDAPSVLFSIKRQKSHFEMLEMAFLSFMLRGVYSMNLL
jgi:hypothetical protein